MFTKRWNAEYEGNLIRIENTWFGEKLFVNDILQDEEIGLAFRSRLYGKIIKSDGTEANIRVSLGSILGVECRLFINDTLIPFKKA